nr:hypothetical protein [Helcococcus sueciensis]
MKEENRRKLNKRNSDNMAIKISMIILGILLIFVITLYAINIFSGNKSKPSVRETEKETVKETIKETEKETAKETEKETAKETEKETVEETEKETEKETVKETEAESEASGQEEQNKPEQPEQPEQNQPEQPVEEPSEPSQIPVPDYEPTVNISIDTIRNASQSEIVDMIIRGELGYGAERLDLLQKAGKDYNFYNNLVDQRLKELGY